jgi:hypothetical protein
MWRDSKKRATLLNICPRAKDICFVAPHRAQNGYNPLPSPSIPAPLHSISVQIGPHILANNLVVAPMAGVTDRPFRQLCKRHGAGYAVSEMVASNPRLWGTEKSQRRTDHRGEVRPVAVQIAGPIPR